MIFRVGVVLSMIAIQVVAHAATDGSSAYADRIILNRARAEYAKGGYETAIKLYSSIQQSSDYYPVAIEERAHTHGKSGSYNKALGDLTTLFSPVFEKSLGPEPYFTSAITHLRLCQYKQVFETLEKYKTNMRVRVVALNGLAKKAASPALASASSALRAGSYSTLSYVNNAHLLPNLFHLDSIVKAAIKKGDNRALTLRVAQLANEDLKEIASNTKKLHLVEAEIMQRLNLAENHKDDDRQRMGKFKRDSGQLVFPYNGEVWLDELDAYQVQSENCPTAGQGV